VNHEIRIFGDPVLRTKATPVAVVDDGVQALGREMITIMHQSEGVGLAAQQIGETKAICVIDVPEEYDTDDQGNRINPDIPMPLVLINPVISAPSKKEISREEGCLSFPDVRGNISRPANIHVSFVNEQGEKVELDVKDFTARVIQHEVDHLNGVLFIDRMSAAKRLMLKQRLRNIQQSTSNIQHSN